MPHLINENDCGQILFDPLGSGEIATRLVVNSSRIGLSRAQLDEVLQVANDWRWRFHELVGKANGDQLLIQRELSQRGPSRPTIEAAVRRRSEALATIELEFVDRWLRIWEIITDEQFQTLGELYEEELSLLPAWVLESRRVAREDILEGRQSSDGKSVAQPTLASA